MTDEQQMVTATSIVLFSEIVSQIRVKEPNVGASINVSSKKSNFADCGKIKGFKTKNPGQFATNIKIKFALA